MQKPEQTFLILDETSQYKKNLVAQSLIFKL